MEQTSSHQQQPLMFCPTCKLQAYRDVPLVLKQINISLAVYMCPTDGCKYPEGYSWQFVKRKFSKLVRNKKHQKPCSPENVIDSTINSKDIDNLINDIMSPVDTKTQNLNFDLDFNEFLDCAKNDEREEKFDFDFLNQTTSNIYFNDDTLTDRQKCVDNKYDIV